MPRSRDACDECGRAAMMVNSGEFGRGRRAMCGPCFKRYQAREFERDPEVKRPLSDEEMVAELLEIRSELS